MPWTSTISAYAHVSLAELNAAIQESAQTDPDNRPQDDRKIAIINQVSVDIDNLLGRQVVTRGALTEYHSLTREKQEIQLAESPIISVTSVHEDTDWESNAVADWYPASSLLVVNVDYLVLSSAREPGSYGRLFRIASTWPTGRRVVKVVYHGGYATTSAVPSGIKGVALDVCARTWRDRKNSEFGVASRTDGLGTVTRMLPAILLDGDRAKLLAYQNLELSPTWERAA